MAEQSADHHERNRRSNVFPALVVAFAALLGGRMAAGLTADSGTAAATNTTAAAVAVPTPPRADPRLPKWTYDGAETGPSHWGALDAAWTTCNSGTSQSPVELEKTTAGAIDVGFRYAATAMKVSFDGRVIRLTFSPGSGLMLHGVRYDLVSATLHTPSEHTVDGDGFNAEIQLTHRSADGHIAIVAILVQQGERNPLLEPILNAVDDQIDVPEPGYGPLDLAALLPVDRAASHYVGSLTTPPCTEGIDWIVLSHPVSASAQQLDAARAVTEVSSRPVQPRNGRTITSQK
jgi:carbonic anhydrase